MNTKSGSGFFFQRCKYFQQLLVINTWAIYIMQREANYPHISSFEVKRKPCAPVAVRNQLP